MLIVKGRIIVLAEVTLKEKTSKGLFWGGMSNFLQQLLNAVFGIYLARTLSPDDYGLVGMLTVFNMLALTLQEGGFVSALINRKEIRHEDYNSVFWFNLLMALACYIILFFCAPLIANYFHQPVLVKLARWSFLSFVLAGFGTAHRAYLTKRMMIRELAIVNIIAVILSGSLGVYLAWKGYAYWTLVIQALVLGFLTNAGFWICSKWRPSFRIKFSPVREMLRYSVKLIVTSMLGILNNSVLTVILGRYYPVDEVGYYTQAGKWSTMGVSVLSGMVNSVAQPVLVSVAEERDRQLRVFRKMIRFAAFISFPCMFGLAFIAPEFISVLLTDKWEGLIVLLQILCVAGSVTPIIYICVNLLLSLERSSQYMWCTLALLASTLIVVMLLHPLGITWMVLGTSLLNMLWLFVWVALVRKEIGYQFLQLLKDILPFMGFTVLSIALAWLVARNIEYQVIRLVAKILLTALAYVLIMWGARSVTFKECLQFLMRRKMENKNT